MHSHGATSLVEEREVGFSNQLDSPSAHLVSEHGRAQLETPPRAAVRDPFEMAMRAAALAALAVRVRRRRHAVGRAVCGHENANAMLEVVVVL